MDGARVVYERPNYQVRGGEIPLVVQSKADTVLEFRGDRPKTLRVGGSVTLCEPRPFGWWDNVNERVSCKEDALHCDPNAFPLYKEVP